ncbi:MAG: tyrosine--tRNA ligase [Fimbriimonas ginsengisoli]|uniref:Tyrosine--tRNA ligase n=1 Tax=Fimbriimonas ginsengisoli TaxID=1005039 RepID=A0A931LW69_FIMGI|nr:tyrosine--tRNA ligase [Fimbriimonas ginsengisoli]
MTIEAQLELLRRGTSEIISEEDLAAKLGRGTPLRVKLGVDPTARDVTLGWAVVLRKLRDFQRLGHTACLIIGDFTAQIGDPSGKNKTRPQLSREEVQANVATVAKQVYRILDPERTEITFNRDWLGAMNFEDVLRLAARVTVARILERDDFTKRLEEQRPIALHEILYPVCQGYDSVQIKADVELGVTDQKFNNLVGRTLMAQYGMEPQVVMLCPLLVGTDGKEKMSQSLGNYIAITEPPDEMLGKTMSIPDELMENYFELATDVPMAEARALLDKASKGESNPRDVKRRLASEIVTLYHGSDAALAADEHFMHTFSERRQPAEAEEARIPEGAVEDGLVHLAAMIALLGMAKSNGDARRLIEQGAVTLDGEKVMDPRSRSPREALAGKVLRVGKHQFRKLI